MKKTLLSFLIIGIIALFAFSCADSSGGGGGGGGTTVDDAEEVGLTDLQDSSVAPSGSGVAVASETQAEEIAGEIGEATANISSVIGDVSSSAPASIRATYTETYTSENIDLSSADGIDSGTVVVTGSVTVITPDEEDITMSMDETTGTMSVTIDTAISMDYAANITYTDIQITNATYTISGYENTNAVMSSTIDASMVMSYNETTQEMDVTSSSGSGITMALAVSYRSGFALSGDTVKGYVVTAVDISADYTMTVAELITMMNSAEGEGAEPDITPTVDQAVMLVYDADGNLIFTVSLIDNQEFIGNFMGAMDMIGNVFESIGGDEESSSL